MALKVENLEGEKTVARDPVVDAILDELRHRPRRDPAEIKKALREIAEQCSKLPILDDRTDDEILGYDEDGLPN